MSEKDTIYSTKVKYTGIWEFKQMYRFLYDWFTDQGYKVVESGYTEKIKPDGKEIEIKWLAKKKISDYFAYNIKAEWLVLGMTETEVQKEGAKVKMNKGYIEIKFSAILVHDYEERWENNGFMKFLRGVYERYIIKGRIDDYEDRLQAEVEEVIAQAKSYLASEGRH